MKYCDGEVENVCVFFSPRRCKRFYLISCQFSVVKYITGKIDEERGGTPRKKMHVSESCKDNGFSCPVRVLRGPYNEDRIK